MNKNNQSNQPQVASTHRFFSKSVKTVLVGVLFSMILLINGAKASELTFMHHVYAGETYVGSVSDRTIVEEWIDQQKQDLLKKYDVDNVVLTEKIKIVPEQVFDINTEDHKVLADIKENARFQTEVKAVELNGKTVAYLSSDKEVEEMLREIKLTAVSEEELETFEKLPILDVPELEGDKNAT